MADPEVTTTSAPVPTPASSREEPEWSRELRRAGIYTDIWETDFSRHSVPYSEIFSGGVPRDGIPPLDDPKFVSVADANGWLEAMEPVIALEIDGAARAYPLQILTWHEIVNDTLGRRTGDGYLLSPVQLGRGVRPAAWTAQPTTLACLATCATAT